eukprot:14672592-Heterocapsa_arctica.AAC.1
MEADNAAGRPHLQHRERVVALGRATGEACCACPQTGSGRNWLCEDQRGAQPAHLEDSRMA